MMIKELERRQLRPLLCMCPRTYAQMLILRACWWKKKMSFKNMSPPAWLTVEKKPLRMRAAMNDSNVVAPAHHAAVAVEARRNQKTTGSRPKNALSITTGSCQLSTFE